MADNQTGMPTDKMEVVFDEVLWRLLDSSHDNGLTIEQVQTVWKAVKGFVHHENFDSFYEKKMKTDQEKFKTIYARAFNIERYLKEAEQEQTR